MKKLLIVLSTFCSMSIISWGQIPSGYYSTATGLQGLKLKKELNKIISSQHKSWNYAQLPSFYPDTDSDLFYENDGTMLDIYSENPSGADPYNYDWETVELISGASEEGLGYNREHILSQSFFKGCYPMYSDLHYVIPTDARVNQRRSNLPFGKVGSSPTFVSLNGTKVGLSISEGYTLTVVEPIDEFKGDIARMLFYAAVRYENLLPHFDTANSRNPFYNNTETSFRPWLLKVLKSWHEMDPVSEKEIYRNNQVYNIQGNRNPFVDHPEYVDIIWPSTPIPDVTAPEVPIYVTATSIGARFMVITWEPVEDMDVLGYEIEVNGTIWGRTSQTSIAIHHLTPASTYNVRVRSYDESYNFSDWSLSLNRSTLDTDTFAKDILFTKVIEGSGYNKAIEISNYTGYTVDLRAYTIGMRQVNSSTGALYWSDNELRLEGELAHGQKIVIMHPNTALECLDVKDADIISASTPLNFDGKMALRLSYNNTTIDMFGAADNREAFAQDESLYRKEHIKNPSTIFNYEEWNYFEKDYCENLGESTTSIQPQLPQDVFQLYPNPVKKGELLAIHLEQAIDYLQVEIYNLLGQIIDTYHFYNTQTVHIPTHQLTPNMYLIKINNTSEKIIVIE